jgi:hypothetical protein
VIEILLQANQEAASASHAFNPVGRLPLHWALATGKWDQGVKPLVEVYPEALTVLDVETKLYPFMLAAQAVGDMDLGTVYEVLRLDPAMFDGLSHGSGSCGESTGDGMVAIHRSHTAAAAIWIYISTITWWAIGA